MAAGFGAAPGSDLDGHVGGQRRPPRRGSEHGGEALVLQSRRVDTTPRLFRSLTLAENFAFTAALFVVDCVFTAREHSWP